MHRKQRGFGVVVDRQVARGYAALADAGCVEGSCDGGNGIIRSMTTSSCQGYRIAAATGHRRPSCSISGGCDWVADPSWLGIGVYNIIRRRVDTRFRTVARL